MVISDKIMNIHTIYRPISGFFRKKRMAQFLQSFDVTEDKHVLDVGGTPFNWNLLSKRPTVTLINYQLPKHKTTDFTYVVADARNLPFTTSSFEIVYSNSVIEHLGNTDNQRKMAQEIRRVGKQYYVQTPNKWFPVEPHYLAPFIHWLPKQLRPFFIQYFSLLGWVQKLDNARCKQLVEEIHLVDEKEFATMFPESQIWKERFLNLVKSLTAVRIC